MCVLTLQLGLWVQSLICISLSRGIGLILFSLTVDFTISHKVDEWIDDGGGDLYRDITLMSISHILPGGQVPEARLIRDLFGNLKSKPNRVEGF